METFSEERAEISRWGKNIEEDEEFEEEKEENQETYEDVPSDYARIQKLENMVAQLQATVGELEEQLKSARDQKKGDVQETMVEQLQRHDYALATRRLS